MCVYTFRSISLSEAADILEAQLGYDRAKAEHFVKQFDRNHDGQLCAAELDNFKTTVRDTSVDHCIARSLSLLPRLMVYHVLH